MTDPFSDVDLCVKCGLCLPHCPTYGKTLDENESPRGRLALIQAWADGHLEASPRLLGHLDNCLLCRSCEAACPAQVPYGRLMDDFRAATAGLRTQPLSARIKSAAVGQTLKSPALQRLAGSAAGSLSIMGLASVFGFAEAAAGLPGAFKHEPWQGFHPAIGRESARVAFFLGCTAELADAETVTAAIRLLNRIGVSVTVPKEQDCCGAMALHAGDRKAFARMQQRNRAAFDLDGIDVVVTVASGCAAVLSEYPRETGTAARIGDVSSLILELGWPEEVHIEPLSARVLVHSPCSLKNVLKSDRQVTELMKRIPGLEVISLPKTLNCCGSAGSYMLDHPEMAQALRKDVLDHVGAGRPDFLVTSNVGCAMHLRAGLKRIGLGGVRVLHPVVLLERQTAKNS